MEPARWKIKALHTPHCRAQSHAALYGLSDDSILVGNAGDVERKEMWLSLHVFKYSYVIVLVCQTRSGNRSEKNRWVRPSSMRMRFYPFSFCFFSFLIFLSFLFAFCTRFDIASRLVHGHRAIFLHGAISGPRVTHPSRQNGNRPQPFRGKRTQFRLAFFWPSLCFRIGVVLSSDILLPLYCGGSQGK